MSSKFESIIDLFTKRWDTVLSAYNYKINVSDFERTWCFCIFIVFLSVHSACRIIGIKTVCHAVSSRHVSDVTNHVSLCNSRFPLPCQRLSPLCLPSVSRSASKALLRIRNMIILVESPFSCFKIYVTPKHSEVRFCV